VGRKKLLIQPSENKHSKFDVVNVIGGAKQQICKKIEDMMDDGEFSSVVSILDAWREVVLLIQPDFEDFCVEMLGATLPFYYSKITTATDAVDVYKKNIGCVEQALKISSKKGVVQNAARAYRLFGAYYGRKGSWKQTIPLVERAIDLWLEYGDAWLLLALAHDALGDAQSSIMCLKEAAQYGNEDAAYALKEMIAEHEKKKKKSWQFWK
jgi:tetratricopeptide (TPR) repeat protein